MLLFIIQVCDARKQEPQEFVISSQKHLNYHTPLLALMILITVNTDADKLCSNFIRNVKLFPQENGGLIDEIYYLCTYQQ